MELARQAIRSETRPAIAESDWPETQRIVNEHFQELAELVKGLAVLGELSPRSIDAISSYGERLSSAIVALAFRKFGIRTTHVDARQD
jgi:aspartate kinase